MKYPVFLVLLGVIFCSACSSNQLLPSSTVNYDSPWSGFEEAKASFDKIIPYETTYEELKALGYDPFNTPNVEILTYLDIINRFMPNQVLAKEDLDPGIQQCIDAKIQCRAYELFVEKTESERYGNAMLDVFNFRRRTKTYGWGFKALVVMNDGLVVYKLWGGKPNINQTDDRTNPLGPIQNSNGVLERLSPW